MASLLNMSGGSLLGKGLPYDAEIEYLESTGTQWINTEIVPTESTSIAIHFMPKTIDATFRGVMSSRVDYLTDVIGFGMSNKYTSANFGSGSEIRLSPFSNNVDYVIMEDKYGITVNGTNTPFTGAHTYGFLSKLKIPLFARSNNGTIGSFFIGKVFYSKIWNNGVLVRDLIPVVKDGVGYMYDKVSGQLFGNAGTDSFILGNDI